MMFNNVENIQLDSEQIAKSWEGQFSFRKETDTTIWYKLLLTSMII